MGHAAIGVGKLERGDIPSAIESLKRATQVALDPFYFSGMSLFLAVAQVHNRDFARAEATLQNVVQYTRDFGIEWLGTVAQMCLGIIALSKGDMNRGLAMMEEVRQVWLDSGRRCFHASLENALGNVYLQIVLGEGDLSLRVVLKNIGFLVKNVPGASNKAEAHFKKALQLAEEIGAKGTLGRTYLDLGRLHKAKKRQDQAKECLAKAVEYFELCEAEAYLKQAREVLDSLA
jgi:tetratricopeptide (TPR) repeat protein